MYVCICMYVCIYIYIYIYKTRLASNEIFSPSNKIHREVGRAKDLSAPRYTVYAFDKQPVTEKKIGWPKVIFSSFVLNPTLDWNVFW